MLPNMHNSDQYLAMVLYLLYSSAPYWYKGKAKPKEPENFTYFWVFLMWKTLLGLYYSAESLVWEEGISASYRMKLGTVWLKLDPHGDLFDHPVWHQQLCLQTHRSKELEGSFACLPIFLGLWPNVMKIQAQSSIMLEDASTIIIYRIQISCLILENWA